MLKNSYVTIVNQFQLRRKVHQAFPALNFQMAVFLCSDMDAENLCQKSASSCNTVNVPISKFLPVSNID